MLRDLPVAVVVRLCTEDEQLVSFWYDSDFEVFAFCAAHTHKAVWWLLRNDLDCPDVSSGSEAAAQRCSGRKVTLASKTLLI
eukprot:7596523-Prorocentrum_lima.AAC.1